MKSRRRILLIAYHYYPDPAVGAKRIMALAEFLEMNGFDLTILTKKLGQGEEISRRSHQSQALNLIPVYQHPGIINPVWKWIKKLKLQFKYQAKNDNNAELTIKNSIYSGSESDGLISRKIDWFKKIVISTQAIFDAKKSWIILSMYKLVVSKLKGDRYDLIISSGPPTACHIIALYGNKLFNAKWIMEARDPLNLWDEVYPICKAKFRVNIENYYESLFYQSADRIVVTTPSLANNMIREKKLPRKKVEIIYNGFDGIAKQDGSGVHAKTRIVYAGSLYLNRDPFNFLRAIKRISLHQHKYIKDLVVDFYGDCETYKSVNLREWVIENDLQETIFINGLVDSQEITKVYENSTMLLNFAQKQKQQIPAKTFDYLKYNALSVVISEPDSDISKILREADLGVVLPDDEESIFNFLSEYFKTPELFETKKDYFKREKFSREIQNNEYMKVLGEVFVND